MRKYYVIVKDENGGEVDAIGEFSTIAEAQKFAREARPHLKRGYSAKVRTEDR